LHDDEAGALQTLDEALRHDPGHDLVGVVNALAALEAQSERERGGEIAGFGPPFLLRDCDGRRGVSSAGVLLKAASVAQDALPRRFDIDNLLLAVPQRRA
jgi:hypothetical protein